MNLEHNGFETANRPQNKEHPIGCYHATTPTASMRFDDHRLVANAGLLLPVTLAHHLDLSQLVQERLDLGNAPGRANQLGDKVMTLVASPLHGHCVSPPSALQHPEGLCPCTLGGTCQGAIHPGNLPAQLPYGATFANWTG